ncbi:esterase-like activity of phytase family protein [Actinophytocola sp.]|uniref:esterase-like activity of phytase family protein n=1 Tax=Actinophytocola sp. TaxID=1872138 RepID=UPI002D6E0451|nr:esterase-like activity of phytase family protein [Actinophytocola sp.]HYQ66874.1 esterase-like activity of phytase family protein [Actinophytocola sp.]
MKRRLTAAAIVAAVSTVVLPGTATADPVAVDGYSVRVLDAELVPGVHDLSGIDYANGRFVAISDSDARVYTADVPLTDTGFGQPAAVSSTRLKAADGSAFPQGGEAVRVDPADGSILWANPGTRSRRVTLDSTVRRSAADGTFAAQYPAAPHTAAVAGSGIRDGGGVAGLTLNPTGTLVISALSAPLLQDGASTVRVSFANRSSGTVLSQLAYELDAAPRHGTNELAEILTVDATHYLVLEHAVDSRGRDSVRLYEATTVGARSVLSYDSVVGATYTPMTKRLLADFSDLDLPRVTNLSGMTWGPVLTTGERTLVLVSDDDCAGRTQLVALAVTH